jgi:hypothetical protein
MTDHVAELEEFGRRRAAAEVGGDVDVLDSMGTKDFILVGPLGSCWTRRSGSTATAAATSSPPRSTGLTPRYGCLATARSW